MSSAAADSTRIIGIIGVGEIARAIVAGLSEADEVPQRILLSPRGAAAATDLATRFPNVAVAASNQEVADGSTVLFLSVRPENREVALRGLRIREGTVIISVMAGVSHDELHRLLRTEAAIIRAIPLPAVRERRSVTATYPSHPASTELFDRLGGTLPVASEASFAALSAVTGTIASFLQYLSTIAGWAKANGVPADAAELYVRSMFSSLGSGLEDRDRTLAQLRRDHETPGGINEQLRSTWFSDANATALREGLDALLERVKK